MFPDYYLRVTANGEVLTCASCSQPRVAGDWPSCPHGAGSFGHTPFDPYIDPHILPYSDPRSHEVGFNRHLGRQITGTRITSREQRKRLMKEAGVDWAPRQYGMGGTEF